MLISMDDRITRNQPARAGVRDRRYAIRFPFAPMSKLSTWSRVRAPWAYLRHFKWADASFCTSKPLSVATRVRITLTRKGQRIEALAVVRILKPRIDMGIEFIDVEGAYHDLLCRWIEQIRQSR